MSAHAGSMAVPVAARRGWGRARIHLNLGDVPAATTAAVAASDLTNWSLFEGFARVGGLALYDCDEVPPGWAWLEPAAARALISPTLLAEFARARVLWTWSQTASTRGNVPGWTGLDLRLWRELR